VHVLRRVFEQAVAPVVVLDVVQGHGLEAPPAQGEDEGVPGLQDAVVPAVLLQPHLTCARTGSVEMLSGKAQRAAE